MKPAKIENLIFIPTYWAPPPPVWNRPVSVDEEAVYDHPSLLDSESALVRCLESLERIEGHCFDVLIVGGASTTKIQKEMSRRVKEIVREVRDRLPGNVYVFTEDRIELCRDIMDGLPDRAEEFMQVQGYSNIRNTALILGSLLDAERIIMIDDDEYVTDPDYLGKIVRALGSSVGGKIVDGLAGYYVNPDGTWQTPEPDKPWSAFWPKNADINATYRKLLEEDVDGDLIETPMVFGGCMAVPKRLYRTIPFDRRIPRGEDFDYLMNARMFGYYFFMHRKLSIVHEPPPKPHADWMHLRQDIVRFILEKKKLAGQEPHPNMVKLELDSLRPYPASFLGDDLMDRFTHTTTLLAIDYLSDGAHNDAKECLKNMVLAMETEKDTRMSFQDLLQLQQLWAQLHEVIAANTTCSIDALLLD